MRDVPTGKQPEHAAKVQARRDTPAHTAASSDSSAIPAVLLRQAAVRVGGRAIWQDATLTIAPGEFVAILGPNGAGKSTLLRVLLGLQPTAAGTVDVFGTTPRRGSPTIGYVPQRRTLDPDLPVRGRDLVMLGLDGLRWGIPLPARFSPARRERERLVDEAIAAVDAAPYACRAIGHLSGGEQQRLLLAQALVSHPQLLLLDEPLASLDLRSQVAISTLVAKLARERGMTVVMVTHDVNPVLPFVDQVAYVAQSRVLAGRPEVVITSEHLSRLYDAPVEVVRDSRGRLFVVGLENESAHAH